MFCRPFWRHTQKKCIAGISSSELHVVWLQGHQHQLCFFLGHFAHFVCCAWSAEESPAQNTTFLNLHERLSKSAERLSVQNIERELKGSTSAYSLRWSLKKKTNPKLWKLPGLLPPCKAMGQGYSFIVYASQFNYWVISKKDQSWEWDYSYISVLGIVKSSFILY